MNIYIDKDYKCYVSNDGTMKEVATDYFNNKCDTYIEGYRFVPIGEVWIREDGEAFSGEMIAPFKPYEELDSAQRKYEQAQLEDMKEALKLLGVEIDE